MQHAVHPQRPQGFKPPLGRAGLTWNARFSSAAFAFAVSLGSCGPAAFDAARLSAAASSSSSIDWGAMSHCSVSPAHEGRGEGGGEYDEGWGLASARRPAPCSSEQQGATSACAARGQRGQDALHV